MAETNDDRRTNVTAATRGGMSFDQLCRGEAPYYVCDKECLVDITHEDTLETAEKKLVEKIEKLFIEIQIQKDVTINKFYIGKTYVRKIANAKRLDKFNPNTWIKEGISSRWGDHKTNDYGKDGMIVITVITRTQIPLTEKAKPVVHQELYTLGLEQRLLHYYKITKGDERLHNDTFTSGNTDKQKSAGYALYVAFSCADKEGVENDNESGGISSMDNNKEDITSQVETIPTCSTESNTTPTAHSSPLEDVTTNCPSVITATPIMHHASQGENAPTTSVPPQYNPIPVLPVSTPQSSLQMPPINITHNACRAPTLESIVEYTFIQGSPCSYIDHLGGSIHMHVSQSAQENEDNNEDVVFMGRTCNQDIVYTGSRKRKWLFLSTNLTISMKKCPVK